MDTLTTFERWYGRNEAPPKVLKLRSGKLDVEFEQGDLRYIRYGGQELIRRIYSAVRDVNWNTIPAVITTLKVQSGNDNFRIAFDAVHHNDDLHFRWHASIEGTPEGVITYTLDGSAERNFRYCRIGFCVLHPIAGIAGSPYQAITSQGIVSGKLATLIEPQRMENGFEAPIFPSCSSLTIQHASGIGITTDFEGDLFEMEDQRNWTDGSFKTYCTPLALGYPHHATAGQQFYQKITVKVNLSNDLESMPDASSVLNIALGEPKAQLLPSIGFAMASHGQPLTAREADLLARLRPHHLKVELHFRDANWLAHLDAAITAARQLGTALELTLFLADESAEPFHELRSQLMDVAVARVLVFHESEAPVSTTSSRWMRIARQQLVTTLPDIPLFGGTNGNFAELNRQRPDITLMDGVSYTINPQVHASDERSLIEGIEAQRDSVQSARSFSGTLPICVSTVTLKPPFNQAATEDEAPTNPGVLPTAVDARQMSLFAAAWTVASLRSLAEGGAASLTYYETTGWRGLLETTDGNPLPTQFRSTPGMIFPIYWIFAWLAKANEARQWTIISNQPLLLDGLAFYAADRLWILLANLQPDSQSVRLAGLPAGTASIRRLNAATMPLSVVDAQAFHNITEPLTIHNGASEIILAPYETCFIELHHSSIIQGKG